MSIYKKFCTEIFDENGNLKRFSLHYPENFNFAYDVVDELAEKTPEKKALVWCNTENEERIFTFSDIRRYSCQMANVFLRAGISRGDRVFVILKRHYEYWFAAIALHRLGAVMIPATHMLTEEDLVYRIKSSQAKAAVCTVQNQVPEKILAALKKSGLSMKLWCVQQDTDGFENLTEAMKKEETSFPRMETLASDPMLLYFTSGTTGAPKGVIHDYTYPLAHIVTAKYWQQTDEDGLHFTVAETGWAKASWGKLYGQWLTGCAVIVYDFDNFDPRQLTAVINRYHVTSFCASPFYHLDLLKKDGTPARTGEIGEIVILPPEDGKQPGIFCSYLDNEKQYEYVWRGGVYHTGDAAVRDENGRFWFHGRFDDIIKTGCFRVGPGEIENVLMEHPAVMECSVIGVPDTLRGQAIKAIVIPSQGYTASRELALSIRDFCNQKLAEYKWIRMVEFTEEMPKTISGKIQKSIQRSQTG